MCTVPHVMATLLWWRRSQVEVKQHPEFPAFCASKCEFTGNKSQPEAIAEDCPAGLLSLRTLFPWCFRAERGAEDLPCSHFALGLVFQGKDLPRFEVLPDKAVGSGYSGARAGWLPILTTNYVSVRVTGNAQHKLHFRTLATAVAKTA